MEKGESPNALPNSNNNAAQEAKKRKKNQNQFGNTMYNVA